MRSDSCGAWDWEFRAWYSTQESRKGSITSLLVYKLTFSIDYSFWYLLSLRYDRRSQFPTMSLPEMSTTSQNS